jgi:DNA helicase-4
LNDIDIKYITVHKSKGLEADNVIVLNLKNHLLGFPNKMTDDPMLSLLLSDDEKYRFAEERRLFYVALTRTKNEVVSAYSNGCFFVCGRTNNRQRLFTNCKQ